jgi:hypothetical protein
MDSRPRYFHIKTLVLFLAFLVLPLCGSAKSIDVSKQDVGFPQECMSFALTQSFPKIAEGEPSRLFVKCSSDQSAPVSGQPRPHYSAMDVKNLTQSFAAVADCLEIDPTWLFPKLMMESGFHTTIQNPNGDAGIGQLTGKAISDVDDALPGYKDFIFHSKKKSCQWIKGISQGRSTFWKPVLGQSKCMLMSKQSNPLKNILYTAIFHKLNIQYVDESFTKYNIPLLLEEAGFPTEDTESLKKILVTLGYNTGGKVAVINLQDYLFSRIDYIKRKSQEFNSGVLAKLTAADLGQTLSYVTAKDFDFSSGLAEFNQHKQAMKDQILENNPDFTDDQVEQAVGHLLRNVSASLYTFPEWLKVWQSHGGPGYVSSIAAMSLRIENNFGAGRCANSNNYRINEVNE